jgi:glucans biosynthesis protein C
MTEEGKASRHYGLDWLRIGAFAILILYHTALYFSPHLWVVNAAHTQRWLVYPLAAVSPWRLMVLFAVSGYASAVMIDKAQHLGRFFKERSSRLLIPLLFGITIIVPPQSWVRLVTENHYSGSLPSFWLRDDFRFGTYLGHTLPHWEHLWFLGYLWAYTALLVAVLAWVPRARTWLQRAADWLADGYRLALVPIAVLITARLGILKFFPVQSGMFDDWIGHAHYLPAFLLGYVLATHAGLWTAVRRNWRVSAIASALAFVFYAATLATHGSIEAMSMGALVAENATDTVMAWAMLPVALWLADTLFNHDHPWRKTLARAIFPAYIVHQTVIVLMGWYLLRYSIAALPAYFLILTAVIATSAFAYLAGSRFSWLGPLLGLAGKQKSVKAEHVLV